jgi:uncharacterized protein YjbI with pentapeptide repeats
MKILHVDGTILFEAESMTIRDLVELAVKSGVSLQGANLCDSANLEDADLSHARLRLRYADLSGANLRYAKLPPLRISNENPTR